jgi:hypothetical protein
MTGGNAQPRSGHIQITMSARPVIRTARLGDPTQLRPPGDGRMRPRGASPSGPVPDGPRAALGSAPMPAPARRHRVVGWSHRNTRHSARHGSRWAPTGVR